MLGRDAGGVFLGEGGAQSFQSREDDHRIALGKFAEAGLAPATAASLREGVAHGVDVSAGMTEVQDAYRPGSVEVDKLLDPVGPVVHSDHLAGALDAPAMHLKRRQPAEAGVVR